MQHSSIVDRRTTAEIRQRLRAVSALIAGIEAKASQRVPGHSILELRAERSQLEIILATRRTERDKRVVSFRRWRDGAFG